MASLNSDEKNETFSKPQSRGVQLWFHDDPELYAILSKYKNSIGWTWKRFFLTGIANSIAKQGDNPDLVVRIADYLERRP